ncbi:hypothetical protein UCRPA7_6968 [Phaeoacremonium minimum UCRPA7]|uniref:Uncharacterized protein n=1 Tax=Phaeoacremonium minimum (strain UCR-PA7) TaxID=1286976 RepID=R8BDY1_PHAM7|nr:hypothetical protein UCRPA7_6968 [Phaeoacremonium minimum UCRPA7]EON97507.1 hypothetical protein UCRPA7_6968 [Phaeoacremonium minimum UCRPA7]
MAFLEDPRLRQRWNQISHNAEAVTENAAAGIWTFQHRYINPCLASVAQSLDSCTAPCFGDREERARRARERERGARGSRAEFNFDFYDDWDDDDELLASGGFGGGSGGILGTWGGARSEDWDRLLAGTGSSRSRHTAGGEVADQPKRKRGMSYGTRGARRKSTEQDPTIIPSTAPLGFLGKLPWKIGGTLRYKPSAANLQDNPGGATQAESAEHEPLLGSEDDDDFRHYGIKTHSRKRSGTTGSGETSDSFRSRNDLFPSDGEGEEDAVPLDDEFAVALDKVDDRGSNKTRSISGASGKGKKIMSRSASRGTLSSNPSRSSLNIRKSSASLANLEDSIHAPSLEELQREEEEMRIEEDQEVERKRHAAAQLALERGLKKDEVVSESVTETKPEIVHVDDIPEPEEPEQVVVDEAHGDTPGVDETPTQSGRESSSQAAGPSEDFVPARLPHFR